MKLRNRSHAVTNVAFVAKPGGTHPHVSSASLGIKGRASARKISAATVTDAKGSTDESTTSLAQTIVSLAQSEPGLPKINISTTAPPENIILKF